VHLTPANLQQMFHRSLEAETTTAVLRAIFADEARFAVHEPLPGGGQFADEGAANHLRLFVEGRPAVHVFAWGRRAFGSFRGPARHPARQTREACEALARLHRLDPAQVLFVQQDPDGIDAGAFHTDVLAVGHRDFLLLHERAFLELPSVLAGLRERLGDALSVELATERELPVKDAITSYPFNSQVLSRPDGTMVIVAPEDVRETPTARAFLDRVLAGDNPVRAVHHLDVRQSMHNGGGPACLRQRIVLTDAEVAAIRARVIYDAGLHVELERWIVRHYRDRLAPEDLADPELARESMEALDELTGLLRLGSVYDFQR
jgi:succinylarginine dihydrolase